MKKTCALVALAALLVLLVSGCSQSASTTPTPPPVNLGEILEKIEGEFTLDSSMENITMPQLTSLYQISSTEIDQFVGKITGIGILGDEIVFVKAKDAKTAASVKQKFDARYEVKLAEMKDYLPEEYDKIKAGKVLSSGNYVAMIVHADAAEIEKLYLSQLGQ